MNTEKTLKTLENTSVHGKKVLLRIAYDITLAKDGDKWAVPDDGRIRATLPTIQYLLDHDCSLILMSWLGRPTPGKIEDKFKLDPVAEKLSELIGRSVKKLDQTVGPEVEQEISKMQPCDIIMLGNTRFNQGEKEADQELAKAMSQLADIIVYDAFAQSHRVHASTTGMLENCKDNCCVGLLMEKELKILRKLVKNPSQPFAVVLGGAKVSDKIAMIRNVLDQAGVILTGGALANPFLKAKGYDIGGSLVESSFVDQAKREEVDAVEVATELLGETADVSPAQELIPDNWPDDELVGLRKIQLPLDVVIAKKTDKDFDRGSIRTEKVGTQKQLCAEDEAILDIGPMTSRVYGQIVNKAATIFWNGPMGLFENSKFAQGTQDVANSIAESKGFSVIGGGDTEAVVSKYKLQDTFDHVSTGGGAALALLSGEELAVLEYLRA